MPSAWVGAGLISFRRAVTGPAGGVDAPLSCCCSLRRVRARRGWLPLPGVGMIPAIGMMRSWMVGAPLAFQGRRRIGGGLSSSFSCKYAAASLAASSTAAFASARASRTAPNAESVAEGSSSEGGSFTVATGSSTLGARGRLTRVRFTATRSPSTSNTVMKTSAMKIGFWNSGMEGGDAIGGGGGCGVCANATTSHTPAYSVDARRLVLQCRTPSDCSTVSMPSELHIPRAASQNRQRGAKLQLRPPNPRAHRH